MKAVCCKLVLRNWGVRIPLFTFQRQFCSDCNFIMPRVIDMQLTYFQSSISPLSKSQKLKMFYVAIIKRSLIDDTYCFKYKISFFRRNLHSCAYFYNPFHIFSFEKYARHNLAKRNIFICIQRHENGF